MVKEQDMPSECGSGCESGWTIYLQQSGECPDCSPIPKRRREEEEEEEDLSMVSDASSGPPQLPPENGEKNHDSFFSYGFSTTPNSGKRRKVERERRQQHLQHHGGEFEHLDDTASSSYSTIPKENNHLIHVNGSPPHKGEEPFKSSYPSTLLKLTSATWQKKSTWENRYLSYYLTMLMSPNE